MNLDNVFGALSKILPQDQLLRKESMKRHTSFHIGGPVDLMILPEKTKQIQDALMILRENDVPFMIMGNGTNLLVRDKGIRGAVIKLAADRLSHAEVKGETIRAQSGILLSALSGLALHSSLTGLEFASGIPGSLGGAVAMNAGAYGGEMKDVVQKISILDENGKQTVLQGEQMALGYRTSIVQNSRKIILESFLSLKKGDYEESRKMIRDLTKRRQEKQPLSYPSAGSTFQRPVGYYAGKLIQDAGLRGLRAGDAQISELHSGFIINLGNATARDVLELIDQVKKRVREQSGVELQPEVRIVGQE